MTNNLARLLDRLLGAAPAPAPVAERDLSIRVVSRPKLGAHHSTYALSEGFWVGALRSRLEGKSLGELVAVSPKKGDFPVLERAPYPVDDAARARNEALLVGGEGGVFAVLQATAKAGGDPRMMPDFATWLGREERPPVATEGFGE